jgi:uncharacterized protein (DUF433 family)
LSLHEAERLTATVHRPLAVFNDPRPRRLGIYSTQEPIMPAKPTVVHRHPDIMGGTPVFVGTRVPVQSLFDYLEGGDSLDEFLRQFPSVSRAQAIAALELAKESVLTSARPAR